MRSKLNPRSALCGGDEDEMLMPASLASSTTVLDQGLVDDGQHLLGHRLGGGQDAGAETGDGEDGFCDFHGAFGITGGKHWNDGSRFSAPPRWSLCSNAQSRLLVNSWNVRRPPEGRICGQRVGL